GLDVERIRQRALAMHLHASGAPFTEDDAARVIFASGVSTADEVNEVAGRGIGLDVVRNEVLGLGGRIEYQRPEAGGTAFRLVVPLSTAVTQVVMLRVGELVLGVP
ncbi:ATP-binding protein, partial [Arthrospira platensis SPKY1]|nr:ATP-binding protein [Arthrospira platensis SPKY1]